MFQIINELIQYRDLLFMLTVRDLKIRYKQAAMGFLWAIFMPVIAVGAGILIKKAMAVVSQQAINMKDIVSITVKVLPWTFFVSAIRFAVQSLVGNSSLVTKIYFPRAVLPLSSTLACFFDMAIAVVALTILLVFFQIGVSVYLLWLPVLIVLLFAFTSGLGLLLSAGNLFFRDIKYIVEIILMFGIFFTPVFFDASAFGRLEFVMLLNPIGCILEQINKVVVLHQAPSTFWMCYATIVSSLTLVVGLLVFNKLESSFAENI